VRHGHEGPGLGNGGMAGAGVLALALLQAACAGSQPAQPQALQPSAQRSYEHCPWGPPAEAPRLRLADATADQTLAREQGLGFDPLQARLVLVELGTQPSGGHRLVLAPDGLQQLDGQLRVHVEHRRPAADAMVTMARTQPCLALVVPREGWRSAVQIGLP
jgi:hypothetical protein